MCFLLLYRFSSVSRSNSIQLTGWIPFFITLGPPSAPSQSLSSPLNQGQCLSVSEADSIDFRNHSISFSSSHRLATKEKKKTHTLHTPQKKKIDFTCTPQKKKTLYLPPNSSRCAKQSRVPLVAPPSLPALIFFSLPRLHCSRALPLLSCFSSTCLMGRRYSVVAGNERGSEKCGEFTESRC